MREELNNIFLRPIFVSLVLVFCAVNFCHAQEFEEPEYQFEFEEDFDINVVQPAGYFSVDRPDSIPSSKSLFDAIKHPDISADTTRVWWKLALHNQLDLKDPTIHYPKFIKFCVDVYNWADHAFNYYEPEYVLGTGKRWKARLIWDSWLDSYAMNFHQNMPIHMMSNLYSNAGAYIQYMAVSVGYSTDIKKIIGAQPGNHQKIEFGFNCARFNAEVYLQKNYDGSYIRKFGDYPGSPFFKEKFPGLTLVKKGLIAYYFFNNKKYSQGAAYNFSRYQIKSQGSAIAGIAYNDLNININFTELSDPLKPYLNVPVHDYRFHYYSFCLIGGYGYNWVWNKHWLFNITVTPGIGITKGYEDSLEGKGKLMAYNILGRTSITYNIKDFFLCFIGKLDGNWYKSDQYSLFNSVETFSFNAGFRF